MSDFIEITYATTDYDRNIRMPVEITEIRPKSDIRVVEKIFDENFIYLTFRDGIRRYKITPEMYKHIKKVLCDKIPEEAKNA